MVAVPRGDSLPEAIPGAVCGRTALGPVALIPGPLTPALRHWLQRAAAPVAVGAEVPPARRDALLATLRSRLLHAGNRSQVAADLNVHPQSVSHRMDRVRELLPGRLEDPRALELLLALMVDSGPAAECT